MEKLTDAEVVKAWEWHTTPVTNCGMTIYPATVECSLELAENTLDLIKRKDAEIERLKKEIRNTDNILNSLDRPLIEVKSEAYREFAEELKGYELRMYCRFPNTNIGTECSIVLSEEIDNTLKELTEEKK